MQSHINMLQPEMLQQVAVNMSFLSGKPNLQKQSLKRFSQSLELLIEGSLSSFLSEKGILPSFLGYSNLQQVWPLTVANCYRS